jgi:hypothetical protein
METNFRPIDLSLHTKTETSPGLRSGYCFLVAPETEWTLKLREEVVEVLNNEGFGSFFVEKVDEPDFAKGTKMAQVVKQQEAFWTLYHATDSNSEDSEASLLSDIVYKMNETTLSYLDEPEGEKKDLVLQQIKEELKTVFNEEKTSLQSKGNELWDRILKYHTTS